VNSKRCGKMLKTCRKYLEWIQNCILHLNCAIEKSKASVEKYNKNP